MKIKASWVSIFTIKKHTLKVKAHLEFSARFKTTATRSTNALERKNIIDLKTKHDQRVACILFQCETNHVNMFGVALEVLKQEIIRLAFVPRLKDQVGRTLQLTTLLFHLSLSKITNPLLALS